MITKFATPFYPERFIRGNLNFLRNRLNLTFYEFINHGINGDWDYPVIFMASNPFLKIVPPFFAQLHLKQQNMCHNNYLLNWLFLQMVII